MYVYKMYKIYTIMICAFNFFSKQVCNDIDLILSFIIDFKVYYTTKSMQKRALCNDIV